MTGGVQAKRMIGVYSYMSIIPLKEDPAKIEDLVLIDVLSKDKYL
jgi:hypothetical protein